MEWSKERTLKLIELLQVNSNLWNSSLCDTRRDKQKRKEELRNIAEALGISIADTTKKIQHLRTQYNRESAREARAAAEDPADRYVSNWYAYEYLHFLKDSTKPYNLIHSQEPAEINGSSETCIGELKLVNLSPPHKVTRTDIIHNVKPEVLYSSPTRPNRDEFSVFGEYVANELRSLKDEDAVLVLEVSLSSSSLPSLELSSSFDLESSSPT
ncbi:hypothetical protein EVAR_20807_1 [Eumeta japonica]|uniref:MADF domain-containing protein n=1 Tax=Eumeta variegata TaxID=151549 RepID=A0A4C1UDC9_EUMVA|nr:hypothetical protein EVAR_20807_1 [Eumeta japonica]